jgi:hypothetical protein
MRPPERRETGEQDLFRSRLDQIIDLKHPLVALGRTVDWEFLEREFGAVYTDDPGRPPLPTRLMVGLAILKHTYDLSDEVLCERLVENPYYQFFCGEEFFQHRLVFDRSSLKRWRNRMGEERLQTGIAGRFAFYLRGHRHGVARSALRPHNGANRTRRRGPTDGSDWDRIVRTHFQSHHCHDAALLCTDRRLLGATDVLAVASELPDRSVGRSRHRGNQLAGQFVRFRRLICDGVSKRSDWQLYGRAAPAGRVRCAWRSRRFNPAH